jgi:hypothetical protein
MHSLIRYFVVSVTNTQKQKPEKSEVVFAQKHQDAILGAISNKRQRNLCKMPANYP